MEQTFTEILMNDARFRELWADRSNTVEQIAEIYGCSPWTVNKARNLLGLPRRTSGLHRPAGKIGPAKRKFVTSPPRKMRAPEVAPPPEPRAALAHPDFPLERDGQIMATGGKYAAIEKLAKRWGLPEKRVSARYLLVR